MRKRREQQVSLCCCLCGFKRPPTLACPWLQAHTQAGRSIRLTVSGWTEGSGRSLAFISSLEPPPHMDDGPLGRVDVSVLEGHNPCTPLGLLVIDQNL